MPDKWIPRETFIQIQENAPMCCVDLVIHYKGKVLLVKRRNNPAKGAWCIPGGRIFKNEPIEEAALRKARDEVGLNVRIIKKLSFFETIFPEGPIPEVKTGTHTINSIYIVEPIDEEPRVRIDKDHSDYRWVSRIEPGFIPYVKSVLREFGLPE